MNVSNDGFPFFISFNSQNQFLKIRNKQTITNFETKMMNYFCGRRGGSGIALFLLGLLSAAVARIQTPKQANTHRALRNCSNNQSCPNRNFCNFDDETSGGCEECPSQNRVCSQMGLPNKGVRHCVNYCFSDDAEDNESRSNDSDESNEDSEDEQEEVEQENGTGNGNSEEEEQESGDVDDADDSEDEQEEEQENSNSEEVQDQESEDVEEEEEEEEDDNDENNENPITIGDNDGQTSYPNNPDSPPPTQWSSISNNFQQHCSRKFRDMNKSNQIIESSNDVGFILPFSNILFTLFLVIAYGISIFAKDWPRDMFLHACNMLAQLLDNDQDGCADDTNVVKTIRASQSGMALFPTEENANYDLLPETFNFQPLYASETKPGCSGSNESGNCRDAAIEEIFHLVTQKGLSPAYKADFGECDSNLNKISNMQKQMDIARGGHFVSVPNNYPSGSIYTYDVSLDSIHVHNFFPLFLFLFLQLSHQFDHKLYSHAI